MALSATQRVKLDGDPDLKWKMENGTDPDEVVASLVLLEPRMEAAWLETPRHQKRSAEEIAANYARLPHTAQELRKGLKSLDIDYSVEKPDSIMTKLHNPTRKQLEQALDIPQVKSVISFSKEKRKEQPATARG